MTGTNSKITASFTFRPHHNEGIEVINPGGWFGKTWLLEFGDGSCFLQFIVEADSVTDAIDELVDSGKGEALIIDEAQFADYGIGTDNPTCHFAGNNGRPVDLEWLSIHGDDRNGIECLYHVEGWNASVKPTELSSVLEKLEQRAECEASVKKLGQFEGEASYVPYFWNIYLDEGADADDGEILTFEVTDEDQLIFPALVGESRVYLYQRDDGFVCETDGFVPDGSVDETNGSDDAGINETIDTDNLDEFTTAYIECALWSSVDMTDEPLEDNYSIDDIAPETLKEMVADCQDFQTSFGEIIADDLSRAGHDFWLTRNGHGAGFWDGDWNAPLPDSVETSKPYETVGDYLTDMSKPYGEVNLYVGDDGKIYS